MIIDASAIWLKGGQDFNLPLCHGHRRRLRNRRPCSAPPALQRGTRLVVAAQTDILCLATGRVTHRGEAAPGTRPNAPLTASYARFQDHAHTAG
jgi:hypothetical protein